MPFKQFGVCQLTLPRVTGRSAAGPALDDDPRGSSCSCLRCVDTPLTAPRQIFVFVTATTRQALADRGPPRLNLDVLSVVLAPAVDDRHQTADAA